jgi:hypothetical protein
MKQFFDTALLYTVKNNTVSCESSLKLIPFDDWLKDIQASRATGWRYRKRGWIAVLNRAGRLYVTEDEVARFNERQQAGEFSRSRTAPHLKAGRPRGGGLEISLGRLRSFFRSIGSYRRSNV